MPCPYVSIFNGRVNRTRFFVCSTASMVGRAGNALASVSAAASCKLHRKDFPEEMVGIN